MAVPVADLDAVVASLSILRAGAGPVEPGRSVDVSIVSSLTDLTVLDPLTVPVVRPVTIDVEWDVIDPLGNELTADVDYVTSAVNALAAGFVIRPPFVPMVTDLGAAALQQWTVRARVTARVDGVASTTRDIVLPVQLAPLPIPELAALFRHRWFHPYDSDNDPGFLLLVVPEWSPVRAIGDTFNDLMKQLDLALRPLRTLAGIGAFLTGIEALRLAAAGQPMTRVYVGDPPDLEDVHMRVETFLGFDLLNRDLRAGDRVSSVVVLGPPGTTFSFYDDEDWSLSGGEWAFELTTGIEMAVVVVDLKYNLPPTMPPNRFDVVQQGGGASFNDNLTSVRFGPADRRG